MVRLVLKFRDSAAWARHIHAGIEGLDTLVADLVCEKKTKRNRHFFTVVFYVFVMECVKRSDWCKANVFVWKKRK